MLFLVLDGIPLGLAREVADEGKLPGFAPPRPMVSVFPSLTHVGVPALARPVSGRRPPGYEARYYHPPTGEIRGGFHDPDAEAAMAPYHGRPRGPLGHAAVYTLSGTLAREQLRWMSRRFQREGGPWLGYVAATDGLGHFQGRRSMRDGLVDIAERIAALRSDHHRERGVWPGVVIASDHGFHFGPLEHLDCHDLEAALAERGFTPDDPGPDRAVLAGMGDVGGGAVHCAPQSAEAVAEIVAEQPGVDCAFARVPEGARVLARRGGRIARASIAWRGPWFRYRAESGDPLDYAALWRRLGGGWLDRETVVAETWDHAYPAAPPRVADGLMDLVEWPAPVLFSMADGHTYGPRLAYLGTRLRGGQVGTHGALSRSQTLGFAAATEADDAAWAAAPNAPLEAGSVFRPWRPLVRAGSAEA